MTAIDLNLAVWDDLLDEGFDLINYGSLNRIHLLHDAFYALMKEDHFIVQLVVDLLRIALLLIELSLVTFITKGFFHINQKIVKLSICLSNILLCWHTLRFNIDNVVLVIEEFFAKFLSLIVSIFILGRVCHFIFPPEAYVIGKLLVLLLHRMQALLDLLQERVGLLILQLTAELIKQIETCRQ